MIWAMIKKQGLLLWRNQSHLLLLIGLPILLIAILGFSLSGIMGGGGITSFHVNVALLEHENEDEQINRFIQSLEEDDVSAEIIEVISQQAAVFAPIHVLKQEVFEQLEGIVDVEIIQASEKDNKLASNDYAALIEVPENFTFDLLKQTFISKDHAVPTLNVYQNEDKHLEAQVIMDVMDIFQEQWALSHYVAELGLDPHLVSVFMSEIKRDIRSMSQAEPITAKTYYTIGMAVMNVLFMASTIAAWAYYEKEKHIFNRLIISRTTRKDYVLGIFITSTLFALGQLIFIYMMSALFFNVYWPDLGLFLLLTCALSLTIGSLAALLSSISYRLNSQAVTSLFGTFIIYIFAFVGGSFFPVGDLSSLIQSLGNFTPNGASMTAYLTIMRGGSFQDIQSYVISLAITAIILLVVSLVVFPKRGEHV